MENVYTASPLQQLDSPLFREKKLTVYIKRDDLIHPYIQGNKWRKLKYNLLEARKQNHHTLLTFGGAYSNHIYATAAAARFFGFRSIGIIRCEKPQMESETLKFVRIQGMELHYVTRETYKQKDSSAYLETLRNRFGNFYLIPEGGTNELALQGVAEIISEINVDYGYLCVACGTGGTLAGLSAGLQGMKQIIGFSSLKGEDTLTSQISRLTEEYCQSIYSNFQINFDYHFGGYAKANQELFDFIKNFKKRFSIQLEPVYTGKMFFGLFDLIKRNYFPIGSRIAALHTGGLQGLCGYPELL